MVVKNIILTFVAMFAVLSIPADRPAVIDPAAAKENAADSQAATADAEWAATGQIPVTNGDLPSVSLQPVFASSKNLQFVSDAATSSKTEPVIETEMAITPANLIEPKISKDQAVVIGVPRVITLPGSSRGFLVSEWLDVPSDVVDQVKTLPVPTIPRPTIRPFAVAETTLISFSSPISKRHLSPLIPKVLIGMPVARPVSLSENASLKGSVTIYSRQLLPLLPEPAAARPSVRSFTLAETTATNVSSRLNTRQLLPLLPDVFSGKPKAGSFDLSETTATNVSSRPYTRQLLPLLPVLFSGKPKAGSFELSGTTASNLVLEITPRRLLPVMPEPAIARPTLRSLELSETSAMNFSSPITARPLAQLLPEPVLTKPSAQPFSLVETTASLASSTIAKRPLQMQLPNVLFRPNLTDETKFPQASLAIGPRPLMPLLPNALAPTSILAQTTSTLVTSSPLSRLVQKLVQASPVLRQTLSANIAAAVTKPVAATINPELTAVNLPTVRDLKPALITAQSVISAFGIIPVPSEMSVIEVAHRPASGPSIENSISNEKAAVPKAAAATLPLFISAQNGFSADMLRPMNSRPVFPPNPNSGAPVVTADNANLSSPDGGYCDPNFVGQPIRFSQTIELKLEDLLNQLNSRFGVNFIIGPGISALPLNVKAGSIPWNVLLRSQLYISGVRAQCIGNDTVELVLNSRVAELEKAKIEAEKLETKYIKLKYLQPSTGGNKNIAGQSTGGGGSSAGNAASVLCQSASSSGGQGGSGLGLGGGGGDQLPQRCKFERLMSEIRQILGLNDRTSSNDDRGGILRRNVISIDQSSNAPAASDVRKEVYVGQVPGRNMLIVNATSGQLREIGELIKRADVPPWQVVIKGLVYTANEDKLKDIGVQTKITNLGTGDTTGSLMGHTLGTLGTLFDFSTIIGTVQFQVQANAFQRDGVISIKSRPFATVLDGNTTDLTVGRQVPVLIQAVNPIGGAPGTLEILQAANLLSVTPHVIDDDQGNPTGVNLELQLESNDVDQSVDSQGVPAISVRSIQSNFNLNLEQTAILGGFTVDSDSKTITKTPGLGDIPILGELFKRRVRSTQINRLYFAISVSVLPYGGAIEPVKVPGATTAPPSLTPTLKKRADSAEPKQVVDPK